MRSSLPPRRFLLSDGIILIAATAVGFSWYCSLDQQLLINIFHFKKSELNRFILFGFVNWIIFSYWACWPMILMWTLASFVLRMRRPRPNLQRLGRQPGFIASCSIAVGTLCAVLPHVILELVFIQSKTLSALDDLTFERDTAYSFGLSVVASWTILALGRRWQSIPNWLDRMGRCLGIYWITMIPVHFWVAILPVYLNL